MDRRTKRDNETGNIAAHAILFRLFQGHRNGRRRRRCAQRRKVCGHHIRQKAEGILMRHRARCDILQQEQDYVHHEDDSDHGNKDRNHAHRLSGMRHTQKDAKNVDG